MEASDRLKIAIEEVERVRTGCQLSWHETVDEEARTLTVGYISTADAQTLGRKLKTDNELEWERTESEFARAAGLTARPCPAMLQQPITPELVEKYRVQILTSLLRDCAVNTKF